MVKLRCSADNISANLGSHHCEGSRSFSFFLVLVMLFSLSGLSLGEKIEYCYNHPLNKSMNWSENIAARMFDPNLGELNGAQIIMNLTILQDVNASNDMDTPVNVTFNTGGNMSLTLPDKSALYVESVSNRTESLAPTRKLDLNESTSKTQNLSLDESQLKRFIASSPNETITLPLVAVFFSSFKADGGLSYGVASKTRSSICIVYDYSASDREKIGRSVSDGLSSSNKEG
jgi:hypothetical protein